MKITSLKKVFVLVMLLIAALVLLVGCEQEKQEFNLHLYEKMGYARAYGFDFSFALDGERLVFSELSGGFYHPAPTRARILNLGLGDAAPYHNDLIFVLNREEAEAKGKEVTDDVVIAWPDPDKGQRLANNINISALYHGIDLESFGLSYPVTLDNLATDWEAIRDFRRYVAQIGDVRHITVHSQKGPRSFLVEIEMFHLLKDRDEFDQILNWADDFMDYDPETGREPILKLLLATGSFEAFFEAVDYIETESLTVEEMIEELEKNNDAQD